MPQVAESKVSAKSVYMKLFRDIEVSDIDMLLPGGWILLALPPACRQASKLHARACCVCLDAHTACVH